MTRQDDVTIRRAVADDAAELAALAARLFEQTFGAANDPEDMRLYLSTAFSADAQAAELADPDRAVWLASDSDGNAIGYAMLRRRSRANGITGDQPAELQRIYVDRSWHGRAVGDRLMAACVDQARSWGADVLWLGVWQENPRAIAFYERSGFAIVGTQSFMLGRDLQHDHVMARSLS